MRTIINSEKELVAYVEGILHVWPQYRDEFYDILTDYRAAVERDGLQGTREEAGLLIKAKLEIDKYEAP